MAKATVDIESIYRAHPLNARTVLDRVARQGATAAQLTAWQLAVDHETEITDQNHPGGVQAVLELASAAGITSGSTVVDIGAGLGGSARVLAAAFGCKVHAIDRDRRRSADSEELTVLARLSDYVHVMVHDATTGPAGLAGPADVLWGQSAWIHFEHPGNVIASWLPVLSVAGRVALADACLARRISTAAEERAVADLSESWGGHLRSMASWRTDLSRVGFIIEHHADRTPEAITHFRRLIECSARWPPGMLTPFEVSGWRHAIRALESGLVEMMRLVAVRTPPEAMPSGLG